MKKIQNAKDKKDRKLSNQLIKKGVKASIKDIKISKNWIYYKKQLWISDSKKLQLYLFKKHHDPSMQGHSGYRAIYANMTENYYWINIKKACRRYAINCSICRRAKVYNSEKQKLLASLPNLKKNRSICRWISWWTCQNVENVIVFTKTF